MYCAGALAQHQLVPTTSIMDIIGCNTLENVQRGQAALAACGDLPCIYIVSKPKASLKGNSTKLAEVWEATPACARVEWLPGMS